MGAERGQMLSHYRLVEKIGEGGMGVVWKAEDTDLNRTVAIKVLPADLALDEEHRRMFLDEARLAASVAHGNIVQVHELGREGDLDFIVMEYVEGQPLNRVLQSRPLSPEKVADWGLQLAQGLARAHRKNLLHRDLKPANILVTPDGEVKIVDFGLAVLFERHDSTVGDLVSTLTETIPEETRTRIAGTLPYMSPEQVRGEKLDVRSDIFSFGTVLYEMTTGQRPFTGSTAAEVAQEIRRSQPKPVNALVPKVPLDLHRIIEKALARRPEDRYQHLDDAAVDLRRLSRELESGPSFAETREGRTPRRWRRPALLAGAALVVAAGALWLPWPPHPWKQPSAPPKPPHARSEIAVLPFDNLSAEGPHPFFARGLQDELLTQLSKVTALKVISRTSVMGYQGTSKPLKTIASELGVGSVVEGSVQVEGERLRVTVQLIDATSDEHLWAEHYDRTLNDAFAIQSEVAQAIVAAVGAALTGTEQTRLTAAPTANAEAYWLYLQGNECLNRPGFLAQNLESAQQLFERALELDPNFAIAHASLARAHALMYWFGHDPSAARLARAREEAQAALRLGPDLPEAHFAMGWTEYASSRALGPGAFRRAADEFAIALKGLPNDAVLWRLSGIAQRRLGNWTEVVRAFEKAAKLDPRSADTFYYLGGHTYRYLRRYPEAVRAYEHALNLAPDLQERALDIGLTYALWQGQLDTMRVILGRLPRDLRTPSRSVAASRANLLLYERAADSLLQMPEMAGPNLGESKNVFWATALYVAWAHQMRGDQAAARAAFDSARVRLDSWLREHPDDESAHGDRGMALAGLGRRGEALREARWLEQSATYREDANSGPYLATDRAMILAQLGEADAAIDELERLLAKPSDVSVHILRLDPRWDPIRDHPRFKAMLAKYAELTPTQSSSK